MLIFLLNNSKPNITPLGSPPPLLCACGLQQQKKWYILETPEKKLLKHFISKALAAHDPHML